MPHVVRTLGNSAALELQLSVGMCSMRQYNRYATILYVLYVSYDIFNAELILQPTFHRTHRQAML